MQCLSTERHSGINTALTYKIIPNALPESSINALKDFTINTSPKKQWYGRLTFWKENFQAIQNGYHAFTYHHLTDHPGNTSIDELTGLFLRTIQIFGEDLNNRTIDLEVYIDRNEVNKEESKKSGLFWHRDGISTKNGVSFTDYSMVYLLSNEQEWKGGDMHLQQGGKPIDSQSWENSNEPILTIQPRYNQAVIFKNSDSAHSVDAIDPIGESVQRDVVIITCKL